MMGFVQAFVFLYPFIVEMVRIYKVVERAILSLAFPIVKKIVANKFKSAGLQFNGTNPEDIKIKPGYEKEVILRMACDGEKGLGETYMDGLWECDALDKLLFRFLKSDLYKEATSPRNRVINYLLYRMFNMQTMEKAFEVGKEHYDTGNDLFEAFLDPTMSYSCAYWKNAKNLNEAQQNKLKLIAEKLKLKEGMKVLDIGCGWGGLSKFLAESYNVQVIGITVGKEGAEYARENCKNLKQGSVEIRVMDYRDLNETFDRIVSVGMFEHTGHHNYRTFFNVVNRSLVDDGIFLLHTIGVFHSRMDRQDSWTLKWIFPNGELPYYITVAKEIEDLFVIEDWHNFGPDYAKTLLAWNDNFVKAWPQLKAKYGQRFYRMWIFYLVTSAGAFQSRKLNLWQIVLTKDGLVGGYDSVR